MYGTIGAGATLNSGDRLSGGSGTDTLVISGAGSFDLNSLATFTGFENVNLTGTGESLTLKNGQNLVVNAGTGNTVTLGTGNDTVSFTGGANTVNGTIGATLNSGDRLSGGSGTDTLVISGAGSFDLNSLATFTGFENVNLTGTGESLTLKNGQNLVVNAGTGNTVTLGTGNDTVSFTGGANTVNGTIGATLNSGDRLSGGSGTDMLVISGAGSFNLNSLATFTGFENVNLTGTGKSLTLRNGQNLVVNAGTGNTVTLGTGNDTVSFTGGTNTVSGTIGAGATLNSSDRLTGGSGTDTLVISGSGSFDLNSFATFTGFENVNLTGTGKSLTLKNGQNLTVNAGSGNTVTLGTGKDTVSFTGGTNTVSGMIGAGATLNSNDGLAGGNGTDTLVISGSGSFDLNSLAVFSGIENVNLTGTGKSLTLRNGQNLSVAGGSGNAVTLGTGNDTVSFTGGSNTVNGTIGTGATLNNGDRLTGGLGTDMLVIAGSGSVDLNSLTAFTGFENVNLTGTGESLTLKNGQNLAINAGSGNTVTLGASDTE
ncbi:beta strand repeat-containing protein [Rhizobium hidalgonense]|uniref:beta strand repeat-containing protein n=1 Tax=Rhizobium hidalgonense TaxID=1538159 RepID=UPI00287254F7|nr:calcium-binding protein [Rhizobium hidalgonense]MDR9808892.1 calcium-binding protein [Rhizobium hidalgonense]